MSKRLEELLAELHHETARQLLAAIRSGSASPGHFMAAIRFLKENGVDAVPKEGSPMADLAKIVPFPSGDEADYHHCP